MVLNFCSKNVSDVMYNVYFVGGFAIWVCVWAWIFSNLNIAGWGIFTQQPTFVLLMVMKPDFERRDKVCYFSIAHWTWSDLIEENVLQGWVLSKTGPIVSRKVQNSQFLCLKTVAIETKTFV